MGKKFNDFQDVTYAAIYKDGYPMNERAVAESMDRNFGGNNLQEFLDKKGIKDDSAIPKGYIDDVYNSFEGIKVERQGWPMFKSHSFDLDEIKNRKHLVDNLEEIDFSPEIEKSKSFEDVMSGIRERVAQRKDLNLDDVLNQDSNGPSEPKNKSLQDLMAERRREEESFIQNMANGNENLRNGITADGKSPLPTRPRKP